MTERIFIVQAVRTDTGLTWEARDGDKLVGEYSTSRAAWNALRAEADSLGRIGEDVDIQIFDEFRQAMPKPR